MYLKTLTVRGFKSFASATTFRFEPGVTAVVGPNGSGKSNVVDALAWVMGEQGAKNLRGGKMEDVIFAGTSGRAPLGRAQVSLTIDNADGALPIEYSEVTISRTLFRNGGSEYAINGSACRLLDIQELLSDSGLGREMHVIVGQGQLDRILQATPEERRGFIEEASGVLKHRRRKERSVRKLESMRGNLDRVRDLSEEVRRQLGPLSRQASTARKAQRIQFDVRDARTRLLADDVARQEAELARLGEGDRGLEEDLAAAEAGVVRAEEAAAAVASRAATAARASAAARDHWYQLSTLAERYRSLAAVAAERERSRRQPVPPPAGPDPDTAAELADRATADAGAAAEEVERSRGELAAATAHRQQAEREAREASEAHTRLLQEAADRRQRAAVAAGRVEAAQATARTLRSQLERARTRVAETEQAAAALRAELADEQDRLAGSLDSEERLDAAYERAAEVAEDLRERLRVVEEALAVAESAHGAAVARRDALAEGLEPEPGAAVTVLEDLAPVALAGLLHVEGGWEAAVAAALGGPADELVLSGPGPAAEAAGRLAGAGAGDARLFFPAGTDGDAAEDGDGAGDGAGDGEGAGGLPEGVVDAVAVVRLDAPEHLAGVATTVRRLLAGTVLVEDLEDAVAWRASGRLPELLHGAPLRVATREGHVLGAGWADARGAGAGSRLERQAAADEAGRVAAEAGHEVERLRFQRSGLLGRLEEAAAEESAALEALNASDAHFTAVTEHLARLHQQLAHADDGARRQRAELTALEGRLAEATAAVAQAEDRARAAREAEAAGAEGEPADGEPAGRAATAGGPGAAAPDAPVQPDPAARDAAEERAAAARHRETEARLALRAAETVQQQAAARAEQARRQVSASTLAHRERERAERTRRAWLARIGAVSAALARGLERLEAAVARADRDRAGLDRQGEELAAERERLQQAADANRAAVARAKDRLHAARMARQEQQLRLDQLHAKAREDLGMTPDYLLEHYGPDVPVPLAPPAEEPGARAAGTPGTPEVADTAAPGDGPDDGSADGPDGGPGGEPAVETTPFDRAEQQKRLRRAERELAALGRVNPLALEEYAAVEERHRFLTAQLADLDASRRDLLRIIQDVDDTVQRVFRSAFEDTAAQFQHVFATLFPGGEGRLFLTDPDNLLESGVEVEARPAGKKVKRLSLLSGGERSLAAVAMLVAIFKARPSPFYVMDEVEAALDDTNLGRLLEIFRELQRDSQLIIITHQKRTMEVADALYGVSMRGDGVSAVISQRLDGAPAAARG
ncbi:chromosome segregation protein SMC [Citricoccus sp. SGAir0253]|uniref:chromosome segregation SMC family protein n=1 Tax=Citricoccus sp. SGAir0253 TaxID=2567881 RepID=UPI0010CCE96F|nr:AAA family ATPase [Citricoccus sp. SGAir0253]QCU78346.1 chromosome segregation protein SMC [Citricoccus sp. SGAir0253]